MTPDDYGRRVSQALRAVRRLHEDTSRLLQDCDGTVGKGLTLATKTTYVTKDSFWSLGKPWMPDGAFRCYSPDPTTRPGLVDAVAACFLGEKVAVDEPVLIVGRIEYRLGDGLRVQDVCDGWDPWYLLANHCDPRPSDVVLAGGPTELGGRWVERFRLLAVPLFSVGSIDVVADAMSRVRSGDT